jgi:hypothetical protein
VSFHQKQANQLAVDLWLWHVYWLQLHLDEVQGQKCCENEHGSLCYSHTEKNAFTNIKTEKAGGYSGKVWNNSQELHIVITWQIAMMTTTLPQLWVVMAQKIMKKTKYKAVIALNMLY